MLEPRINDFHRGVRKTRRSATVNHAKQNIRPTQASIVTESKKSESKEERKIETKGAGHSTLAEMILADRDHIRQGGRHYFTENAEDMRDYYKLFS